MLAPPFSPISRSLFLLGQRQLLAPFSSHYALPPCYYFLAHNISIFMCTSIQCYCDALRLWILWLLGFCLFRRWYYKTSEGETFELLGARTSRASFSWLCVNWASLLTLGSLTGRLFILFPLDSSDMRAIFARRKIFCSKKACRFVWFFFVLIFSFFIVFPWHLDDRFCAVKVLKKIFTGLCWIVLDFFLLNWFLIFIFTMVFRQFSNIFEMAFSKIWDYFQISYR